jgi:hypothetical protein
VSSGTKRRLKEIEARLEEEKASRRRLEEEYKARVEARVEAGRKEYAKKLKDEARKRELAETRYNKRFRKVTMWRVKAHRAIRALRETWVRRKDGTSARAGRVQVQTGGNGDPSRRRWSWKQLSPAPPERRWQDRINDQGAAACLCRGCAHGARFPPC